MTLILGVPASHSLTSTTGSVASLWYSEVAAQNDPSTHGVVGRECRKCLMPCVPTATPTLCFVQCPVEPYWKTGIQCPEKQVNLAGYSVELSVAAPSL